MHINNFLSTTQRADAGDFLVNKKPLSMSDFCIGAR